MLPAKEAFGRFLEPFALSPLKIPVVSNVEASFYPDDKIKILLTNQLIKPVRWVESTMFLMERGEVTFKETGPGEVLTKMVWGIQRDRKETVNP
jgi:trans-AT polyketide synthase/acyltransferase/oxidoreductase domain-containing protein